MEKDHYDAKGDKTYSWMQLRAIIQDKKSREYLSKKMLFQLWVIPFIEIRIYKNNPNEIQLRLYGCGTDTCITCDFNERRKRGLRNLYTSWWKRGWVKIENNSYVAFMRDARVIPDPARRYS